MVENENQQVGVFIGGVQKAGTTSLHSYFAEHPSLLAPDRKETHFFDDETGIDWSRPDYDRDFHRRFYGSFGTDRIAYEATPITFFWPPSIGRIMEYNPAAKFIFLFRDPVERAFSHWSMEFDRGAESLSFSRAIRAGRDRLRSVPRLHPDQRTYSYVERGFYAAQLERALSLVPLEQIRMFSSRELACEPARTLAAIAEFLCIPPFPNAQKRKAFVGSSSGRTMPVDDSSYLKAIFAEDAARFSAMSGLDTTSWLAGSGD